MRRKYLHLFPWVRGADGVSSMLLDRDYLSFPKGFRILENQVTFPTAVTGPENEIDNHHLPLPLPI